MSHNQESRDKINAMYPREHALARKLLGCDWCDVESQARRVIGRIVSQQPLAISNERAMLANRIKQYVSKASFSASSDKHSVLDCVDLLLADVPFEMQDEQQAFDTWVVKEAGEGAVKRWPVGTGPMYDNARVQDYRTGWVECLLWMRTQPIEPGAEVTLKWKRDSELLDAIQDNCWDVRFSSTANADAGDGNINIEIVGHYMAKPHERVVGENYSENLRAALEQATTADAYPPERPEYENHLE